MAYSPVSPHSYPHSFVGEARSLRPRMPSPQPSYSPASKPTFTTTTVPLPIPSPPAAGTASSWTSPASTPSYLGTNGSLQSTPEGLIPVSHCSLPSPAPLTLSDSHVTSSLSTPPNPSPAGAMAAAMSKGTGLIRRASRGAQQIPGRFRRKGSNAHRDSSSGPVIMRRRSDSRGVTDVTTEISDLDLKIDDEEAVEDLVGDMCESLNVLGIMSNRPAATPSQEGAAIAPVRHPRLEQGTNLVKVTKGKKREVKLRLDFDSAKVYWDPARPSKQFYIDDVREIRIGEQARDYRVGCGIQDSCEPFWFTIIYLDPNRTRNPVQKTIHLVAPDKSTLELWTHTLDSVSRHRIEMMAGLAGSAEKSARTVWRKAMDGKFGGVSHPGDVDSLDVVTVMKMCRSLHINCQESTIHKYFAEADSNDTGRLDQAQFLKFVRRLKERKDIKRIYENLAGGSNTEINKEIFFAFLRECQGIQVDDNIDHWTAIFDRYARASKSKATPPSGGEIPAPLTMGFSAFQAFLSSSANSVYAPASSEPRLTRPLNEYFISSSHNTYLLGRQVYGESSTEAYVNALEKGCRCIEVDCWDGSDGLPIVTHGRTLTEAISFSDTIKTIDKYAFSTTPYPLIISLEVHCSPEQQVIMTEIMTRVFGDKLVLKPLNDKSVLPSPEDLKHKILIKVKIPGEDTEERTSTNPIPTNRRQRSISSPWSRPVYLNDAGIPPASLVSSPMSVSPDPLLWLSPRASTTSTNTSLPTPNQLSSAEDSDGAHMTQAGEKKRKKPKTSNIVKVLGELGVYTQGVKFTGFGSREANTFNHIFSFAERTFEKLCKPGADTKQLLEEHNARCLMRVYPSGHRISSSNFDPMKFWRRGVQMAALNWQTYDLGQQINEAMFAAGNDRTGYVLKPLELRHQSPASAGDPKRKTKKLVRFSVDIISAQQLPRPREVSPEGSINPYVEFEMYNAEEKGRVATGEGGTDASARNGLSGIGQPLRKRTHIFKGNGYDPTWDETIAMTLVTRYPDLVFVRWTVWNSVDGRNVNSAPLASFTAKLSSLQQGYRHLPLFNINGEQYLFSTLFCKIKKEDSVEWDEGNATSAGSVELPSAFHDGANNGQPRSILRSLFSRTPSGRKKRKDETKESVLGSFSRSSTMER